MLWVFAWWSKFVVQILIVGSLIHVNFITNHTVTRGAKMLLNSLASYLLFIMFENWKADFKWKRGRENLNF